jgi:hypothetical protein
LLDASAPPCGSVTPKDGRGRALRSGRAFSICRHSQTQAPLLRSSAPSHCVRRRRIGISELRPNRVFPLPFADTGALRDCRLDSDRHGTP